MARAFRHNIPCAFCKVEFFPSDNGWSRYRKNKPTYCSRACVKSKQAAEAHARNPDRPCTTCGEPFMLSPSQRDKIKVRPNTGLYCSTECLHKSRVVNFQKRRESGKLPVWGTPAQVASAKKLGEYSLANKRFGPAHPMWKGGKHTEEAKAKRRAKRRVIREQKEERRAPVPKQYPCMLCGVGFTFGGSQRERWYKYGTSVRYCCSHCKPSVMMADKPAYYYAPAECSGCKTVFNPQQNQRIHRDKNPDAHIFCSYTCVTRFREDTLETYRDINGVMKGPTHPSWKTGWHSKEVQQAKSLIHNIKKSIKEGARA